MSRRTKVSQSAQPENSQRDQLRKKKELFIQQFEKEAEERINEMEAKLDKLLATLDRTMKIEMMKLPQSLHTTLIKDIMCAHETSVGEVTMAIESASPEISKPLSREPSKKENWKLGKGNKCIQGKSSFGVQQKSSNQSKTDDGSKRRPKKKMLSSNSTGRLRCGSTISAERTPFGVKKRVINRSLSDLSGFTITTSLGDTLFLSEDNKDEVQLELLDDLALHQMQKIKELMDYLCNKVKMNNTQ